MADLHRADDFSFGGRGGGARIVGRTVATVRGNDVLRRARLGRRQHHPFVARDRHEIALGRSPIDAATAAMAVCGKAMLVMSVILITGLLPMTMGRIPPIRTFGLLSIFAIATAMVADLVMLPSLLVCFAPRGASNVPELQAAARSQ